MRTREVLRVLTVAVAVFAFAFSVNAADIECGNCNKCGVGNVPCPETIYGPQGSTSITNSCPFDYDGDRYTNADTLTGFVNGRNGSWGYCDGANYAVDNPRNCKVLFDICECPEACEFVAGQQIGIRMTIKTQGVYWADPNMNTIFFDMFTPTEVANGTTCNQVIMDVAPGTNAVRNFGEVRYYRDPQRTGSSALPGTPVAGCFAGNVGAPNDVTTLESVLATDYLITINDANACYLWLDIPAMRLDGTARRGDAINVEITLLYDRLNTGLCTDCHPPITCSCVRQVGVVCCDVALNNCMYFPYVTESVTADNWWTGVVVTNLSGSSVSSPTVKMTLTDSAGSIFTYEEVMSKQVQAWTVGNLPWAQGGTPVGASWLKVDGNFQMDGYQFIGNPDFGAGTLARRPCP